MSMTVPWNSKKLMRLPKYNTDCWLKKGQQQSITTKQISIMFKFKCYNARKQAFKYQARYQFLTTDLMLIVNFGTSPISMGHSQNLFDPRSDLWATKEAKRRARPAWYSFLVRLKWPRSPISYSSNKELVVAQLNNCQTCWAPVLLLGDTYIGWEKNKRPVWF